MNRYFPKLAIKGDAPLWTSKAAEYAPTLPGGAEIPPSYRAFAEEYGYGLLGDQIVLYLPMSDPTYPHSLQANSERLRGVFEDSVARDLFEYEPDGSPELVRRLVPFGITTTGYFFAWDPQEPTGASEYRIYGIGPRAWGVWRGPRDLYEFVRAATGAGVKQVMGPGAPKPLPAVFEPARKGVFEL